MAASGHTAQRTCLGCRQQFPQDRLVRYVLSPQGELLIDYRHRLPGRGAYTCLDLGCLAAAVKRRQFDRAFRAELRGLDERALAAAIGEQIRLRVLNLLGMARKSAQTVSGSNLVLDTLKKPGKLALVLLAEDVSSGVAEKVTTRAGVAGIPCFRLFDKDTQGQVLGKGERSIVALLGGPLAETIKIELSRYENIAGER